MRFVATKTAEQQSCLTLHRTRHLLIRQQTSVINAIRAHVAEFGIVAPVGRNGVDQLLGIVADLAGFPTGRDPPQNQIVEQCAAAGIPLFVKQRSAKAPLPPDLYIRQLPRWPNC